MKNHQKGASAIGTTVLVIVVLAALAGIYYWQKDKGEYSGGTGTNSNTYTAPSNSNSSGNTSGTYSGSASPNSDSTVNTTTSGGTTIVSPSNVFPGGSEYESPYGLKLAFPATWNAYAVTRSSASFGGINATESINFTLSDGPVLTINVFTKEQWNDIKIQETNTANATGQTNVSLGEGEYLGENSTYIYSYTIKGHQAEAKQVLANIIKF